jgi:prepilin-type N-terminal cleavage/methylation domain-containing protein
MRARLRSEEGFSLVELLTVLVLMGILLPALALMLTTTVHWTSETQEDSVLQTEARGAIDRLTSELRQAYSGDTTSPITSITPQSGTYLTFLTPDRTVPASDGSDAFHELKVSYRLNGNTLERASWSSTNTTPSATAPTWTFPATPAKWIKVLGSIRNPSSVFTFKDGSNPPVSTPTASLVRSVDILVKVGTTTSQGRQFNYQTTATLRVATLKVGP